MKIVTSVGIGGPWQSGKEENNDNSRRKLDLKGDQMAKAKKAVKKAIKKVEKKKKAVLKEAEVVRGMAGAVRGVWNKRGK